MTLSDISIKNPVFAWMLMLALVLFGLISFDRMGVSQMPDVDFPIVNVSAVYEGASPDIIETDVIDIIEDQIMSVEGIVEVTSTAQHSRASITVELDIDRDVDAAVQEINTKISQARMFLPYDMEPPIISKRNPEDFPIIWVSLYTERPLKELMDYARYHVKDRFQTIPGVADVRLAGYVDRNLRIWVDRDSLFGYELSVDDIITTLGREHVEIPGGLIETDEKEIVIRSMGEADTAKIMGALPIIRTRRPPGVPAHSPWRSGGHRGLPGGRAAHFPVQGQSRCRFRYHETARVQRRGRRPSGQGHGEASEDRPARGLLHRHIQRPGEVCRGVLQ